MKNLEELKKYYKDCTPEEIIEDMLYEYNNLAEEFEEYKKNIEDNYRPIPLAEQYEIYDRDFMEY